MAIMSTEGQTARNDCDEETDVLIIGAGLAGIGMAVALAQNCPDRKFLILEQRGRVGGTWDLFKYPGVRSDSDMQTLGFSFKPWMHDAAIAEGEDIQRYIADATKEFGISRYIRFEHRVRTANWDGETNSWSIKTAHSGGETERIYKARFLVMCTGYYDYDEGYKPEFPGSDTFEGPVIHPQHWPQDFDPTGRRIAVIGSGATAVTLVPALAKVAAQVIMVQRSPGYIASRPRIDPLNGWARRLFGDRRAYSLIRWHNLNVQRLVYWLSIKFPDWLGNRFLDAALRQMPNLVQRREELRPNYAPCEQRLCVTPDGEFFRTIRDGSTEILTDVVREFRKDGLLLESGRFVECDTVVTATGLRLRPFGGVAIIVNRSPVNIAEKVYYKGAMLSDVPNLVSLFGYVNISWTLRTELIASYVCRLLNFMSEHEYKAAQPNLTEPAISLGPMFDESKFSPGYYLRTKDLFPRNSMQHPWRISQDISVEQRVYLRDPIDDGHIMLVRT
jgi:monooxygenase